MRGRVWMSSSGGAFVILTRERGFTRFPNGMVAGQLPGCRPAPTMTTWSRRFGDEAGRVNDVQAAWQPSSTEGTGKYAVKRGCDRSSQPKPAFADIALPKPPIRPYQDSMGIWGGRFVAFCRRITGTINAPPPGLPCVTAKGWARQPAESSDGCSRVPRSPERGAADRSSGAA